MIIMPKFKEPEVEVKFY